MMLFSVLIDMSHSVLEAAQYTISCSVAGVGMWCILIAKTHQICFVYVSE